ncbi:tail protein [Psychrobacter phage vB_PmaS_Y8A]|nr:tail protein [Psychrobacter phage vB_PmaS_Y8A]
MTYVPPDLSLDVVLQAQTSLPTEPLNIVICAPVAEDVFLTIDGSVAVTGDINLSVAIPDTTLLSADATVAVNSSIALSVASDAPEQYEPPSLTITAILLEQLALPQPPLDVVLCKPDGDDSKRVSVAIDSTVNVSGELSLSTAIPETEYLTIDGVVNVDSLITLDVERFVVEVGIDSTISVTSEMTLSYNPNVFRGAMYGVSSDFQQAKLQGIDKQGQFESNKKLTQETDFEFQQSQLIGTDNQAQFEANVKLVTDAQLLFEDAKLVGDSSAHKSEYSELIGHQKSLLSETASLAGHSNWYSFEAMLARQTERKIQAEYSYLDAIMRRNSSDYGKLAGYRYSVLIETAKIPPWRTNKSGYKPPPLSFTIVLQEQLLAPQLPLNVVLCAPKNTDKDVQIAIDSVVAVYSSVKLSTKEQGEPPNTDYGQGVIFVTNSVSLNRSDNGREIKMLGFSVGIDSNSYCWTFSATVPLSELSKVDTAREQRIGVDFTCNGNLWRFILDDCSDSVSFGENSLTIKGKSRAMLLAHPYAQQRGFKFDTAMSARQIAESELNRNGVASGFTLDWQLAGVNGWNVPANTYSYTGKTPINSLQWIAEAAGGFINADMSADILHVLAHYPIPSWEWAAQTPSINLPMSLITSRSRGRVNKPAYNGVTIYGENDNGIGALIKRTGTSGGYQPPMVTSDLMTDTAAAISRGKMILSDTGDIGNIGISMPLVADVGVLKPSTLIGVNDGEQWVGMVKGTTITGRLSSNRALEIDQSIDVERHFDKG